MLYSKGVFGVRESDYDVACIIIIIIIMFNSYIAHITKLSLCA